MNLQAGECYRMRNGSIAGPLSYKGYDSIYPFETSLKTYSWTEDGRWNISEESGIDIVEHIPKEKEMKEQIKVAVSNIEIEFMDAVDGTVKMTFEQIKKAFHIAVEGFNLLFC